LKKKEGYGGNKVEWSGVEGASQFYIKIFRGGLKGFLWYTFPARKALFLLAPVFYMGLNPGGKIGG
jgi:hypothetical protein